MTNIIEIVVRGSNELDPIFDEVKAKARTQGRAAGEEVGKQVAAGIEDAAPEAADAGEKLGDKTGTQAADTTVKRLRDARGRFMAAGQEGGDGFTQGLGSKIQDEIPRIVDKPLEDTKEPAKRSGGSTGLAFASSLDASSARIQSIMEGRGQLAGAGFKVKFTESAMAGKTQGALMQILGVDAVEALAKTEGDRSGFNFTDAFGGRVRGQLPGALEKPLADSGKKGGTAAGGGFAAGFSPLVMAAVGGLATIGPAALIAGAGVAVAGIAALVGRSNADVAAKYQALGQDVSAMLTQAVEPFAGDVEQAVTTLDRGLTTVGPELKDMFGAAAPYADDIAHSMLSLVEGILPGFTAGLREAAPLMQVLSVFTGDIGQGIGEFTQNLGTGSGGAALGLQALGGALEHVLADVGQIAGSLSSGLGPALKDILGAAVPVADALANVVSAFPPKAIEYAGVATAALFAAFKISALTGAIAEGTTFTAFLKGLVPTEATAAAETTTLSASFQSLLGPAGAVLALLPLLTSQSGSLSLVNADLKGKTVGLGISVSDYTTHLKEAGDGSRSAQQAIDGLTGTLKDQKNAGADISRQLGEMDQALASLFTTDKAAAAKEYSAILGDLGLTAQQGSAQFPLYAKALSSVQVAAQQAVPVLDSFTGALQAAAGKAGDSAKKSAEVTLAALGLMDGTSNLTTSLYNQLQAFTLDGDAASAFKTTLDALFGKYQSYSDAQASFTTDLASTAKQLKYSSDGFNVNTDAGAANYKLMSTLATANESRAEALLRETGSQQRANQALQAGALAIDQVAKNAGFTKTQIDALNLALYGTKNIGAIKVPISADTSSVYSQVDRVIKWVGAQTAYVQVQAVGTGASGGRALLAHGGAVGASHAAEGGPRGNVVTVGEHGEEDVQLPVGSTVFSHEDTLARRASQQQAGPLRLEVEWVGGGAGDKLLTWLREAIRIRGGNVQTVLGH